MLNKQKVLKELEHLIPQFTTLTNEERKTALEVWNWLIAHSDKAQELRNKNSASIAQWVEPLETSIFVEAYDKPYYVLAVDGSQIYPDKHQGLGCYLLNIGYVLFIYADTFSKMERDAIPSIYALDSISDQEFSQEKINCQRSELEFKYGLQLSSDLQQRFEIPQLFLCDGSLIFWHLDSKDKTHYLRNYIELLDGFSNKKICIAGYISQPKSKELIALLRLAKQDNVYFKDDGSALDYVIDSDIIESYCKPFYRSALFEHNSQLIQEYPPHLRPHFIYLNTNDEIARIEVPSWIAQDKIILTRTLSIIIDQIKKGNGYPIALSEAHEQAVVKGNDRDFFYQALMKVSNLNNYYLRQSQKSLKKKYVSI